MRLLLFPSYPVKTNGYGIAVKADMNKLNVSDSDYIIWYVTEVSSQLQRNQYIIKRYKKYSFKRILNTLLGRNHTEVLFTDLPHINTDLVDEVFCGEVVFYRALRKLFPDKKIIVRFHNCFARIKDRVRLLGNANQLSLLYRINLRTFYNLEKEIMSDSNVYKVFISAEDRTYYTSNFGRYDDSEVWGLEPNVELMNSKREHLNPISKLVWFGGLDSHKIDSVKWFINKVFVGIRHENETLEFHLFGEGTQQFDKPQEGIYGHGFYDGDVMPFKSNAIYINPDLTGGGVKIKLLTYFENGIRFITTPFGFEGYPNTLIDNEFCFVVRPEYWQKKILELVHSI